MPQYAVVLVSKDKKRAYVVDRIVAPSYNSALYRARNIWTQAGWSFRQIKVYKTRKYIEVM